MAGGLTARAKTVGKSANEAPKKKPERVALEKKQVQCVSMVSSIFKRVPSAVPAVRETYFQNPGLLSSLNAWDSWVDDDGDMPDDEIGHYLMESMTSLLGTSTIRIVRKVHLDHVATVPPFRCHCLHCSP